MALTPDQEYELQLLRQGSAAPQTKGLTPDQVFELQQLQAMAIQPQDLLQSKQDQAQQIHETQVSPELQQAMQASPQEGMMRAPYEPQYGKLSELLQSPQAQAILLKQAQGRSLGTAVPALAGMDYVAQLIGAKEPESVFAEPSYGSALAKRREEYKRLEKEFPISSKLSSVASMVGPGGISSLTKAATSKAGQLLAGSSPILSGIVKGIVGGGVGSGAEALSQAPAKELTVESLKEVGKETAKGAALGGVLSAGGETIAQLGKQGLRGIFKSNELGDFAFDKFKNVKTGSQLFDRASRLIKSSSDRLDNVLTAERNVGKTVGLPTGFNADFLENQISKRLSGTSAGKEMQGLIGKVRAQNGQLDLADARRLNTLTKEISNPFKNSSDVKDNAVAKDLAKFGGALRKSIKGRLSKIDQAQFEALNKNIHNSIDIKDTAKIISKRPIEFNEMSRRGITKAYAPIQALTAGRKVGGSQYTPAVTETLLGILGL